MLEERSKKGAGRSMRALAWRVCAWVLPLYRNLEPITRKPLGGGSGDTSLQWRNGGEERDQTCIARLTTGLPFHCPISYDNSEWSRRGETWEKRRGAFPRVPTSSSSCSPHSQNTDITHTYTHSLCLIPSYPTPGSDSPEERVVLDADLPQSLGRPVVWELKANRALKLLILQNQGGWVRSKTWAHSHHQSFLSSFLNFSGICNSGLLTHLLNRVD